LSLSDDGSGKGAALIAIVADRFQRNLLRTISSFDENEEEEVRHQFQHSLSNPLSPIPQPATNTLIRTLP
jgi:endonuclease III-like uncharacterized protein